MNPALIQAAMIQAPATLMMELGAMMGLALETVKPDA
jgi:hypothetical protein